MATEIITVKRPHKWLVKRGSDRRVCSTCGANANAVASKVCYEEEVEREVPGEIPPDGSGQ